MGANQLRFSQDLELFLSQPYVFRIELCHLIQSLNYPLMLREGLGTFRFTPYLHHVTLHDSFGRSPPMSNLVGCFDLIGG